MIKNTGDFIYGMFLATLLWAVVAAGTFIIHTATEHMGYSEKLVMEYHNPNSEYERTLFMNLLESSGVETNFLNKTCTMYKYGISITLTNPEDCGGRGKAR